MRRTIEPARGENALEGSESGERLSAMDELLDLAEEAQAAGDVLLLGRTLFDIGNEQLRILLEMFPPPEIRIEVLQRVRMVLEGILGERVLQRHRGDFADSLPTNHYILVRQLLAEALFTSGRFEESMTEWIDIQPLTAHHDLGSRLRLLPLALARGRDDLVQKLFRRHKDEVGKDPVFAWCRVLDRWKTHDFKAAPKALHVARQVNPHAEAYLVGIRMEPIDPYPERGDPRSPKEVRFFAPWLLYAWRSHPGALAWLRKEPRGPWHRRTPRRTLAPRRWDGTVPRPEDGSEKARRRGMAEPRGSRLRKAERKP